MGSHFLDDFVRELEASGECRALAAGVGEPWYNPYGDCIQYQTVEAAYVGERVDDFLTIFRHHEDGRAIGFQIKGVQALLDLLPIDGIRVEAEVSDREVKKVSLSALLLVAYGQKPLDEPRIRGYAEAIRTQAQADEVEVFQPAA